MTAATPGPPPRDHHDGQVTPGQAAGSDWWVCDGILPPHGTGQKIIGPFATQELALNVRTYVEKAGQRTDLWVDDEPATPQPAPELTAVRALLDHETRLTWQAGLPGERARVAAVREQAGLEALT